MLIILFLFNILTYIVFLKIFFIIFKNKYIFPIRIAELINFITNLIINSFISLYFFEIEFVFSVLITNLNLFFIFYSIVSMISTSPRTKILLDVFKSKTIKQSLYLKKYSSKYILNIRIKRLLTNNEIIINKNKILINKQGLKFFTIVVFILNFLKKL